MSQEGEPNDGSGRPVTAMEHEGPGVRSATRRVGRVALTAGKFGCAAIPIARPLAARLGDPPRVGGPKLGVALPRRSRSPGCPLPAPSRTGQYLRPILLLVRQ
ncbi:MAG: hypothetical protein M0T78_04960 [Actinomycetota bacterium]|nr:hypothetical protein [Actinomycetota bacterium]